MKKILLMVLLFIMNIKVSALAIEERWVNSQEPYEYWNSGTVGMLTYQDILITKENIVAVGGNQGENGYSITFFDKNGKFQNIINTGQYYWYENENNNIIAVYSKSTSLENSYISQFDIEGNKTELGTGTLSTTKKLININGEFYILSSEVKDGKILIEQVDEKFKTLKTYEYEIKSQTCTDCIYSYYIYKNNIYFYKYYNELYTIVEFDLNSKEYRKDINFDNSNYDYLERILNGGLLYVGTGFYWAYNTYDSSALVNPDNNKYFEFKEGFSLKDNFLDSEGYYISGLDTDGAIIYKLDKEFNKTWEYRVEVENSSFKKIIKIDNYIYAILQFNEDNGNGSDGGHNFNRDNTNKIIVLDNNGNFVTEYNITNELLNNSEFHVIKESEHGFIIAGEKFIKNDNIHGVIAEYTIIHDIETKTDGNGTVEADHVEAENGTEIKFTVTPKEGFKLKEVKVTDANGNVVTFTNYTFTMPNANVLIEATFIKEEQNPNTSDFILITCTTLLLSGITLTYINYRKTKLR